MSIEPPKWGLFCWAFQSKFDEPRLENSNDFNAAKAPCHVAILATFVGIFLAAGVVGPQPLSAVVSVPCGCLDGFIRLDRSYGRDIAK